MAVTTVKADLNNDSIERHVEQGAANTLLTVSLGSRAREVLSVSCKYSGAATQAGVTTGIDSGAGAAFDATLNTGSANAQTTVFLPTVPIALLADDALVVTAPAGGVGVTAAVEIRSRPLT